MIDLEHSSHERNTPQVIHGEVRAPLIFIFQKRISFRFSALLVAHEIDVDRLAELRENRDDIAFGEAVWKPADVNVCCVAVVCVPGSFCRSERGSVNS